MEYLKISASQLERMCDRLSRMIKGRFNADCIVGISRGGLIPAVYLSDRLGVRKLYVFKVDYYEGERRGKKPVITQKPPFSRITGNVLVVDDVADTGRTLSLVKGVLKKHAKVIKTATLHYKPHSAIRPDFFVKTTGRWIIYPYQTGEIKK